MDQWFAKGLLAWYRQNKRDLPWRSIKDPYKIWLSEVILQQTRVEQGTKYYHAFTEAFPSIAELAQAREDKVLKLWQGLGYYSRARNLHASAKQIMKEKNGIFPDSYSELLKLRGVGSYTAAAISSFAFNEKRAVVDGNVYRVLSRVFGISVPIDSAKGKADFQALADQLIDNKEPGTYNQAVMEFGSQYCKPIQPDCSRCIFKSRCTAFLSHKVALFPVKEKKIKVRTRHMNYLVVFDKEKKILINKRKEKDIWAGLYDFPLIETDSAADPELLISSVAFSRKTGKDPKLITSSKVYKHILSHQILQVRFFVLTRKGKHDATLKTTSIKTLTKFAFPRLIEKFLNDCNLNDLL